MNKILIMFLEIFIAIILYMGAKVISDSFLSGWIAGAIYLAIIQLAETN